ncbi:hypothetical protein GA0116959_105174 [Acinetobacter albensis]|uniref:Uncharacterized protein n=1 Tax=Acinetobacter albensis TaxID=1673609 RepID=A0A1C4GVA5_9GAMM|nr:hypothetical protein GA0116959_105174 [Acinetobacter albensis]
MLTFLEIQAKVDQICEKLSWKKEEFGPKFRMVELHMY